MTTWKKVVVQHRQTKLNREKDGFTALCHVVEIYETQYMLNKVKL